MSPLRGEHATAVPVDSDSRLELVRQVSPAELDVDPILPESVWARLRQLVSERQQEPQLMRAGLSPTRSVLFTGPPGVGKSMAAKWLAREIQRPLLVLDLSSVMSSYLGRSGANVRYVLDYAKTVESILLLDEFDAIAKRRDDSSEIGELKRLVTVLLQEVDDWPSTGLLLAATNHPDLLDPAVWRRFEMLVNFPMPTDEQATQAVRMFMGGNAGVDDEMVSLVSAAFTGASFNDIEREVHRIRRESIVLASGLREALLRLVHERVAELDHESRLRVAVGLVRRGCSQREAHDLTGVSRDTIRKRQRTAASSRVRR